MRTACAALLTLAVLPLTALARQAPQRPLEYAAASLEAQRLETPLVLAGAHIFVEGVTVNGKGPFRFMLDTGAEGAGRIDASLAEKLGLNKSGNAAGTDGSGRAAGQMTRYRLDSLSIGALSFTGVQVLSRDYNADAPPHLGHIDGILGFHLFQEFLLTVDYPARTLTVTRGELPAADGNAVLPFVSDDHDPEIEITVADQTVVADIDTGSFGGISVPGALAEKVTFAAEPKVIGRAQTVSGPFEIKAGPLDGAARIGAIELKNPQIMIVPMPKGNIGGAVLSEFILTFDQRNARVRFARPEKQPH